MALVTQGVFTAIMTLAVVLAVQQIEGHILQPFILGRAVRVHPLAVVLSVTAAAWWPASAVRWWPYRWWR